MPHRIFLSHKWEDKPLVEAVALRLREIFGEDAIFYDAWSIKPGDGIIEKMNEGLSAPEFVFFFVSRLSLASGLVKLEWQNALFKASKGETRLIPVRVDNVAMPDVLRQSLYIDLYSVGLEAVIVLGNSQSEVSIDLNNGAPMLSGYYEALFGPDGGNGFTVAPMGGAITPERPMKIVLKPNEPPKPIKVMGLIHGWSEPFRSVPLHS